MKQASPPALCQGENCSCAISEVSFIAGEKRSLDLRADEDPFLFVDNFLSKRRAEQAESSVTYQIGDNVEASSSTLTLEPPIPPLPCADDILFVHSETEESFRESFYASGTDWSCLYAVDDYGMPHKDLDDGSTECASEHYSDSGCRTAFDSGTCLAYDKVIRSTRERETNGRLVQSTLATLWGFKHPSVGNQNVNLTNNARRAPAYRTSVRSSSSASQAQVDALQQHRNWTRQYVRKGCPFYKKIPGTNFTVDAFRYGEINGCNAYFLTHFHSDHYGGLTKSWSHGPIYCTPITARLLLLCLYVDKRWIHPICIGATHVVEGVEVTFLDANHCPGSAIILFRLPNDQLVLHTGDFRACKEMQSYPELNDSQISTVYLDTTYCNPRYRFPLQKDVINFVIQVTQTAIKRNKRTLVVVGAYSIGKERVYLGIAEALNVPIFVDYRRSQILKALEWPELVSRLSSDASSMLHVLPIGNVQPQKLTAYLRGHPAFTSVLAFRPTGWTYSEKVGDQLHLLKPSVSGSVTVYGVPYSEHSSYCELQEFIRFVRPNRIISTVNVARAEERERMQSIFQQWLGKTT